MTAADGLSDLTWRTSSFIEGGGSSADTCVQTAALPDGQVAVRSSRDTESVVLTFTRVEIAAWAKGVKAGGEFDDLT